MTIPPTDTKITKPSTLGDVTLLAAQKEEDNQLIATQMSNEMGAGFLSILAVFFSFLNGNQDSILDNSSVKNMFTSFGFKQNDMDFLKRTGEEVKNGEMNYIDAARKTFSRINDPKNTLSAEQAKTAIGARATQTVDAIHMALDERRELVIQTMPIVAKEIGVTVSGMKAAWGVESGYGASLLSPTGCEGDWQFADKTWNSIIKQDGAEIAGNIKKYFPNDPHYQKIADHILENKNIAGTLKSLQYDPVVSTFAKACLARDDAKVMGINPKDPANDVKIYAAHNIGAGSAKRMLGMAQNGDNRSMESVIGSAARNNPAYFHDNATAGVALSRMSKKLAHFANKYEQRFGPLEREIAQDAKTKKSELGDKFAATAKPEEPTDKDNIADAQKEQGIEQQQTQLADAQINAPENALQASATSSV